MGKFGKKQEKNVKYDKTSMAGFLFMFFVFFGCLYIKYKYDGYDKYNHCFFTFSRSIQRLNDCFLLGKKDIFGIFYKKIQFFFKKKRFFTFKRRSFILCSYICSPKELLKDLLISKTIYAMS